MSEFPRLIATVLDTEDAPALAAFWRDFLGLTYRPGQGPADDPGFIVLDDDAGSPRLAVQQVGSLVPPTWPLGDTPAQMHLDLFVPDLDAQRRHVDRALGLGARVLDDRSTDGTDPLVVLADPAGHPFCLIAPPTDSA